MLYKCPDGHDSETNDFCSECGLEIQVLIDSAQSATRVDATTIPSVLDELCPACKTERDGSQTTFCEVCGYNFVTGEGGGAIPVTPPSPSPSVVTAAKQSDKTFSASATPHIEIEITFDETISEAHRGMPARKFSLYDDENLIGRRSKSIAQTLGIDGDDFISRRHLLILRASSGAYVVRLFDGTNGATLNGAEMTSGVELSLAIGDIIAIGTYTLIKVIGIQK